MFLSALSYPSPDFVQTSSSQEQTGTVDPADEEFDRAAKAVLDAVTRVEGNVEKLVSEQVHTLFPKGHEHHEPASKEAKKAVNKAAQRVKDQLEKQQRGEN